MLSTPLPVSVAVNGIDIDPESSCPDGVVATAVGSPVSIVIATLVVVLVLPAASFAVTMAFPVVPSASAVVGVTLHVPLAAAVVVIVSPVPGITTVMVLPASEVPVMVGFVLFVMPSVWIEPVSLAVATAATGAAGGVISDAAEEPPPPLARPAIPPIAAAPPNHGIIAANRLLITSPSSASLTDTLDPKLADELPSL